MRVMDSACITATLCKWRHNYHSDRSVAIVLALIPSDEDRSAVFVRSRAHDFGNLVGQPGIPGGYTAVVHVVAQVGCQKVVICNPIRLEICCEFGVGPNVSYAVLGCRAEIVRYIRKVNKRIVTNRILIHVSQRTYVAWYILL